MIQPIPARGMRPRTIEIKSITERIALLKKTVVCAQFQVFPKTGNMMQWLPAQATTAIRLQGRNRAAPLHKRLARSGLEHRVHGLAILGGQGDFLRLLAELFMDKRDGVIAGRQALDLKLAVGPGDREEGALRDVDEHPHPGVLVALYWEHDFFARERFFESGSLRGLRLVPLAVVLRSGVDIVCGGIAVDDLDGLASDYAHHMGMVAAAALIKRDGFLRGVEGAATQAFLHVDENVREMGVRDDDILGYVRALARGILAHVNLSGLWRGAIEFDHANDDGSCSWVNRRGGGCSGRGGGLLFRGFFFATSCDQG